MAGFKYGKDHCQRDLSPSRDFVSKSLCALSNELARSPAGIALSMDLSISSPVVRPGDLVIIDPPYAGTTAYGAKLTRERVVELALAAHGVGSRVLVHEAEPVIEGPGWQHVELERRHGANQRTWSKQRREVATLNFEPKGQLRMAGFYPSSPSVSSP